MKERLEAQIRALLERHRRIARSRAAAAILSACMAFCVIAALMNPAAALTDAAASISISCTGTAEPAESGATQALHVQAEADADTASVFVLSAAADKAALSDQYAFDDQGQMTVSASDGTAVTISRIEKDSSTEYSFTLSAGQSVSLDLLAAGTGADAGSMTWTCGHGSDLASAEAAIDVSSAVTMSWAAAETAETDTAESESAVLSAGSPVLSSEPVTITDANNLAKYVNNVSLKRKDPSTGNYVAVTSASDDLKDGDSILLDLSFTNLLQAAITAAGGVFYYQLPKGVWPSKEEAGNINNDASIGTYTISTDGLVTMTFNSSYTAGADGLEGSFGYSGKASLDSGKSSQKVDFDTSGGTTSVTITHATDLSVAKTGAVSDDGKSISYTVTASSTKGTDPDTVTISDNLNYGTNVDTSKIDYSSLSFKLYRIDSNGTKTEVTGYTPTIGSGKNSFTYDKLPALSAGESYQVVYAIPLTESSSTGNGYTMVNNTAKAVSSDGDGGSVSINTGHRSAVEKSGAKNADNTITWTITVNPTNWANLTARDLSGYVLKDDMAGLDLASGTSIVIKNSSGSQLTTLTADQLKSGYQFPAKGSWGSFSSTDIYTITYTTAAPSGNTITSVKNSASVSTYTAEATVTYPSDSITKQFNSAVGEQKDPANASGALLPWTVTIKARDLGLAVGDTIVYSDTIADAEDAGGAAQTGTHYGIASEIQAAIDASLSGNESFSCSVEYFDANGASVPASDSTTKVHSFKVTLTAKQAVAGGTETVLNYETHADYSKMASGETWKYVNWNGSKEVDYPHTEKKPLEKLSGTSSNGYVSYASGDTKIAYSATGGILYYEVKVNTDASTTGDITIKDYYPAGTALVDGSVSASIYKSDGYTKYADTTATVATGTETVDGETVSYFTVTIPDGYNKDCGTDYRSIYITYRLSLTDDWTAESLKSKVYDNKVTWGASSAEQKTTVKKNVNNLTKTGAQVKDASNNVTSLVAYSLVINPDGDDLNESEDTIILTDTLSADASITAVMQADTIKLYKYDSAAGTAGDEIPTSQYSYTYDALTHKLVVTLPDQTPCMLVYQYYIDRGASTGNLTVKNSASLQGSTIETHSNEVTVKDVESHATVSKPITVYKVDSKDYTQGLQGAVFTLEGYDSSAKTWSAVTAGSSSGTYTTGTDGKIEFSTSDTSVIQVDKLYRLTETAAPTGYALSGTPTYFVRMSEGQTKAAAETAMGTDAFAGIAQDSVLYIPYSASAGGTIYVPDELTSVKVSKVWKSQSGDVITSTAAMPDVTVQLYRQEMKVDGYTVTLKTGDAGDAHPKLPSYSIFVKQGSQLTINFSDGWSSEVYTIYSNGTELGTFTMSQGKGSYTLTVNSNMNLTVTCSETAWLDVTASFDYTLATHKTALGDKTAYGDPITLNSSNSWSHIYENLEKTDAATGNTYYYFATETKVPGYTASYDNGDGITSGQITITNQSAGFDLPSTGGIGTAPFILAGLLLTAVPLGLILRRHLREGGGG